MESPFSCCTIFWGGNYVCGCQDLVSCLVDCFSSYDRLLFLLVVIAFVSGWGLCVSHISLY